MRLALVEELSAGASGECPGAHSPGASSSRLAIHPVADLRLVAAFATGFVDVVRHRTIFEMSRDVVG
jgi:hypothetical protein